MTAANKRLFGFLLFGGLLPVAVVAASVYFVAASRLKERVAQQLAISAEQVRDRLDREMYDRHLDLKSLADAPALAEQPQAILAAFSRASSKKYPNLSRKLYLCLSVVRADGTPMAEAGTCELAGRPGRGPAGAAYTVATRALRDGAPVLDVYFPLAPGAEAAGLRATEDLRSLSDLLVKEKLAGGLAQDVVVYSPENQILARKNGEPGAALAEAFPLLDRADAPAAFSARGALAGGRPALAAANTLAGLAPPLDALKWRVAVIQPLDDTSAPNLLLLEQLRGLLSAAAAVAALVSVAGWAYFFWNGVD